MNLAITNDMNINFVHDGQTYIVDKLVFNENGTDHVVYEKMNKPQHTPVTEIKMSNPQDNLDQVGKYIYVNTGVEVPNAQDLWCEATITKYKDEGFAIIGLNWDNIKSWAGNSFKYIWCIYSLNNYFEFDYAGSNWSQSQGIYEKTISKNTATKIEWGKGSIGYMYYVLNGSATSNYPSNTFDYSTCPDKNIYINICACGFRYLKIWSDYTKANLLFDGIAAIDENNTPCIYDAVSNTLKYFTYKDGYTGAGTVTYIA